MGYGVHHAVYNKFLSQWVIIQRNNLLGTGNKYGIYNITGTGTTYGEYIDIPSIAVFWYLY